jgi:hypothetical protein
MDLMLLFLERMPSEPSAGASLPCPTCGEGAVVLAREWLGQRTFFCPDCEHSWEGDAKVPSKPPPTDDNAE